MDASAAEGLLRIGQPAIDASFLGVDETGALKFRVESQDLLLAGEQLIRWSTYRPNTRKAEVVLNDGTRVVLAESWTGELSWQFVGNTVIASTELFGKVSFARSDVRAILVNAPKGLLPRTRFMDRSNQGIAPKRHVVFDQWRSLGRRSCLGRARRKRSTGWSRLFRSAT